MVVVPGDNLDGGFLVECHLGAILDNLGDLVGRQHAGCTGTFAAAAAFFKLAAGLQAVRALHGEAAAVEAEAEVDPLWVDVVAPEQLEGFLYFREVGVGAGVRPEGVDF